MSLILTLHHHRYRICGISPELLPANTLLFANEEADAPCEATGGTIRTTGNSVGTNEEVGKDIEVEFTFEYHFVDQLPTFTVGDETACSIPSAANAPYYIHPVDNLRVARTPNIPDSSAKTGINNSTEKSTNHKGQLSSGQFWGAPTHTRHNIIIWQQGSLQRRQLSVSSPLDAYAVYEETSSAHADIYVLRRLRDELRIDTIFISTLSLERHLAPLGIYIFHCAYMCHNDKAILLSGPSGAGKSTHAELWNRHVKGTRVVNGDRALICREADGSFVVEGWPVCGSSGICHNEVHPLDAIVFIEKTPDNQVIPGGLSESFRRLFAQLTVNHWDAAATSAAADWVMQLCMSTQVVTYGCNMAPDAPFPLAEHLGHGIKRATRTTKQQRVDGVDENVVGVTQE